MLRDLKVVEEGYSIPPNWDSMYPMVRPEGPPPTIRIGMVSFAWTMVGVFCVKRQSAGAMETRKSRIIRRLYKRFSMLFISH